MKLVLMLVIIYAFMLLFIEWKLTNLCKTVVSTTKKSLGCLPCSMLFHRAHSRCQRCRSAAEREEVEEIDQEDIVTITKSEKGNDKAVYRGFVDSMMPWCGSSDCWPTTPRPQTNSAQSRHAL
uniref:Uncharacterized protein n=1 Tax=Ditylenchus dipsaci TaxID=166011 RepID=A0A915DVU0_9BILA